MSTISIAIFVLLPVAALVSQVRILFLRAAAFALLLAPIALAAQAGPAGQQPDQSSQTGGQSTPSPDSQPAEKSRTQPGQSTGTPCQCTRPSERPAPRHDSRLDLGISLNGLAGTAAGASGNAGFGARASYYLIKTERAVALDAEFTEFLAHSPSTILRGGRATQGLFGIKIAGPTDAPYDPKFIVFWKVRPGFISWSDAVTGLATGPQGMIAARHGRSTNLAIDFGMTTDIYLGHEWWSRIDVGDTVVWYPTQTKNNFQLSSGVFYRF
jgi:hypothetical protein